MTQHSCMKTTNDNTLEGKKAHIPSTPLFYNSRPKKKPYVTIPSLHRSNTIGIVMSTCLEYNAQ